MRLEYCELTIGGKWQAAGEAVIMAAEDRGPLMHARIGTLRALNRHVVRVIGSTRLQQLDHAQVDALYKGLGSIAQLTQHHVHTVLNSCLSAAVRKG